MANAVVASAICTLAASRARASAEELPLSSYEVDPSCPAQDVFGARVLARLGERGLAADGVQLGVEIVRGTNAEQRGVFEGRLHAREEGEMASTREVQGASCAEVIEALALLAALSLETRNTASASEPVEPPPPPDPPASSTRWRIGPLALALAQSAAAPEGALGAGVGVGLQTPAYGALQPWGMLAVYRTVASTAALPDSVAQARFHLTAVYAVGCPVRWPAAGWWSLRPCVDVDVGRLTGRGLGSDRIETRRGLWASAGVAGRGEVHVWGPVWLAALVGAVVPLARHEFYFAPDAVVFRVPAIGWRGAGFVSLLF
ncbi:MAG: hypothetical protein ABW217_23340 [Polyangiaceae bacterium]